MKKFLKRCQMKLRLNLNKKEIVLSVLLWTWGAAMYFMLEVIYKTAIGNSDRISWTMMVLAFILCIPIERCGYEMEWETPLLVQASVCAALVTVVEFLSGLLLNVHLGLNVWDYSDIPFNICGQICPQFSCVWFVLCFVFIPVFDYIRYILIGGESPRYTLI